MQQSTGKQSTGKQSTGKDKKNPSYLTKTDLIKYN